MLFVLAADIVLADDTASFLFVHGRLGLPPDAAVSWLLPRVVGHRSASHLILTNAIVGAAQGQALGIVTRLVSPEDLRAETMKLARGRAGASQAAIKTAKRLLAGSASKSLPDQLQAEREGVVACVGGVDFAEGVSAFLEKRAAIYSRNTPPDGM